MPAGIGSRSWMLTSPWSRTASRGHPGRAGRRLPDPPGAGLDPVIVHQAAAATIRSLLGRLAGAITDPAAARSRDTGRALARPGTSTLASSDRGSWEAGIAG